MTFVDDFRQSFDASDFCETVRAGVGEGRITSEQALRDTAAVSAAAAALQEFAKLASAKDGPDVVAAYVSFSPGAAEIFTALRAISSEPAVASVALDCLTCIVRYSLDPSRPQQALEGTRSVVKEVVKTRAVLLYEILASHVKPCAKKALNLLRLVAMCHPLLAREIVNRFDLASEKMAPALCSVSNNHCRVPFLDLMFSILACGERDVLQYLSTKGRDAILACLRTIEQRTIQETAHGREGPSPRRMAQGSGKPLETKPLKVLPSHVQKRELVAAINFLLAIEKHLLVGLHDSIRRSAFGHPIPKILAAIASTEIPPLKIAPREVVQEQRALRTTASRLVFSISKDLRVSSPQQIVSALNTSGLHYGNDAAVKFVMEAIAEQPRLCKPLLEDGRLLSTLPALSTKWFAHMSIISSCVLRLPGPITTFRDKKFFERCLTHADPLVRHFGCLLSLSFCKVVGKSRQGQAHPGRYLPPVDIVRKVVGLTDSCDNLGQKLLAAYQLLFREEFAGTNLHLMILSVDAAGGDMSVAGDAIEGALHTEPYEAARKVVHRGYLSELIIQASRKRREEDCIRLWRICGEVMRRTDLFPPGTETEIDVYLSVLSSLGKDVEACAKAFEDMTAMALQMPYGLYDRLYAEGWSESKAETKTSLLAVAAVLRLQKLREKQAMGKATESDIVFENAVKRIIVSVTACQSVTQRATLCSSYLMNALPSLLSNTEIFLNGDQDNLKIARNPFRASEIARMVVEKRGSYPMTVYLRAVEALSLLQESRITRTLPANRLRGALVSYSGQAWDSWCDLNEQSWKESQVVGATCSEISRKKYGTWKRDGLLEVLHATAELQHGLPLQEDLKLLRACLEHGDFVLALGSMLRTTDDEDVLKVLIDETLRELNVLVRRNPPEGELIRFLIASVLAVLKTEEGWSHNHCFQAVSACLSMISLWDTWNRWEEDLSFFLRMLNVLVSHNITRVSVCSRALLAQESVFALPPLTELSPGAAKDMLAILSSWPEQERWAVCEVLSWSKEEHRACHPSLLPFVAKLLSPEHFKTLKDERRFDAPRFSRRFVEAAGKAKKVWTNGLFENGALRRAVSSIGKCLELSNEGLRCILESLSERQRDGKVISPNIWVLLGAFLEGHERSNQISDSLLTQLLSIVMNNIGDEQLRLQDGGLQPVLWLLVTVLNVLTQRKAPMYNLYKDVSQAEKKLKQLCSVLMTCFHRQAGKLMVRTPDDFSIDPMDVESSGAADLGILLCCVKMILSLDLDLEGAAKDTLSALGTADGMLIVFCTQELQQNVGDLVNEKISISRDPVSELAELIVTALARLPRVSDNEQVSLCLHHSERALSSELAQLGSSHSARDTAVRLCMTAIGEYKAVNTVEERLSLQDVRGGYFKSRASAVMPLFHGKMLEDACDELLTRYAHSHNAGQESVTAFESDRKSSLDPFLVLHTFLRACGEALSAPQTPVLDFSRLVRDGPLGLALTGVASLNEELRALSYACLDMFASVVGPSSGIPVGSAAALYRDRRQLAFLLELLRNSIPDSMTKVLPLFAVWFRTTMKVAVTPSHHANKLVTTFFLRAPVMDVSDCYGLFQTFDCDASGQELKAARLLALEVLRRGVHTPKDVSVVRRRRIFDFLFMLAGSKRGSEASVRLGVLKSIEAMIIRDGVTNVSRELADAYGIVLWVANDARYLGETLDEFLCKLDIIRYMATTLGRQRLHSYAVIFADSLQVLVDQRLYKNARGSEAQIAHRFAQCGAAISQMLPTTRSIFPVDFADLYWRYVASEDLNDDGVQDFVACICRQQNLFVPPRVIVMLLDMSSGENIAKHEHASRGDVDPSMIHIFVAEHLLSMRHEEWKLSFITSDLCFHLAKAMQTRPTIWLALAALTVLDLTGSVTEEVLAFADDIPAFIPKQLDRNLERQFGSVVSNSKLPLVECLISCADNLDSDRRKPEFAVKMDKG